MVEREYILVQTMVGRPNTVVQDLRGLEGVQEAVPVSGQYDLVLHVEHHSTGALAKQIDEHPAVARTVRCGVAGSGSTT